MPYSGAVPSGRDLCRLFFSCYVHVVPTLGKGDTLLYPLVIVRWKDWHHRLCLASLKYVNVCDRRSWDEWGETSTVNITNVPAASIQRQSHWARQLRVRVLDYRARHFVCSALFTLMYSRMHQRYEYLDPTADISILGIPVKQRESRCTSDNVNRFEQQRNSSMLKVKAHND